MPNKYLLTFKKTEEVIRAQRYLMSLGFNLESRITPRQLSYECGICLEIVAESELEIEESLKKKAYPYSRLVIYES